MTDARHGNSILKNEQHLFTQSFGQEKAEEKREKCWKASLIDRICTGETTSKKMKGSHKQLTFRKTAACPTSSTLLSLSTGKLSPMVFTVVKQHLETCEFCSAELTLLVHHRGESLATGGPPEIPTNLRILAESILGEPKKTRV